MTASSSGQQKGDLWEQAETVQKVADALRLWCDKISKRGSDAGCDEDRELTKDTLGMVAKHGELLEVLLAKYKCPAGLRSKFRDMLDEMTKIRIGHVELGDYWFHAKEWGGVHISGGECSIPGELDKWASALRVDHHAMEREPAYRTGRSGGGADEENGPSTEDLDSCREVATDVRKRPEAYRQAGQWLDERFSFSACMKRLAAKLWRERRAVRGKGDWQTDWWRDLRDNKVGRTQRRETVLGKHGRLLEAVHYWLNRRDRSIGEVDAHQIVLVTALLLDPDAHRIGEPLMEFHGLSWDDGDRPYSGRGYLWHTMTAPEQQLWIELARRAGKVVAEEVGPNQEDPPKTDWREVKERLLRLYKAGEAYTGQAKLAERLTCSRSTINKAINDSAKLRGWMARHAKRSPRAQSINEVVADKTVDEREDDPADSLPEDEVDRIMAQLIGEAKPAERAKLNGMNDEGRREIAKLYRQQEADKYIEEEAPKGNRTLGRKP